MSGLSTSLYDSASIDLISDHSAAAKSGAAICGRALSDVAHGSSAGLRYFEVELTQLRSSSTRYFGAGFTDVTTGLTTWIGGGSETGVYVGAQSASDVRAYASGSSVAPIGASLLASATRIALWLDPSSRRVWVSTRPRNGWLVGVAVDARPDLGTAQQWTVGGTGAIRFAVTPGFGSGSDRNIARARTRYGELVNCERYGALPWDARSVTINLVMRESIGGPYIAAGTEVSYAVFEGATPGTLSTPTTVGTATMGASGALALPASISVDPGSTLTVLVSTTAGTPGTQARSHYMPVTAP